MVLQLKIFTLDYLSIIRPQILFHTFLQIASNQIAQIQLKVLLFMLGHKDSKLKEFNAPEVTRTIAYMVRPTIYATTNFVPSFLLGGWTMNDPRCVVAIFYLL